MFFIKVFKFIKISFHIVIILIKMFSEFQAQNQTDAITPGQRIRNILNQRKCSYCRGEGHNVTNCNNTTLLELELFFLEKKSEFSIMNAPQQHFTTWLMEVLTIVDGGTHLIKSYAIRKCNGRSRDDIFTSISKIVQYIYREDAPVLDYIPIHEPVGSEAYYSNDRMRTLIDVVNFNIYINNVQINRNLYMNSFINSVNNLSPITHTNNFKQIHCNFKEVKDQSELSIKSDCSICYDTKEEREYIAVDCGHKFCKDCSINLVKTKVVPCCALCRSEIRTFEYKDESVKKCLLEFDNH